MEVQLAALLIRASRLTLLTAASMLVIVTSGVADTADVSQLFGDRVTSVAGAATPILRGDFDGDGKLDLAFLVNVAPSKDKKAIASDVSVVDKIFGGQPLGPQSQVHGLAIALSGGAKKFLIVDVETPASGGFFAAPLWTPPASGWDKTHEAPLKSKKRGSEALKGFPCLGKASKGDVILLGTESSVDVALVWTGTTFKKCENPNDEP